MNKYIAILLLALSGSTFTEQAVINDYDDARNNYFHDQLYIGTTREPLAGYTLVKLDVCRVPHALST
jgi:hypothetical protein